MLESGTVTKSLRGLSAVRPQGPGSGLSGLLAESRPRVAADGVRCRRDAPAKTDCRGTHRGTSEKTSARRSEEKFGSVKV
jgi:hypothetical protein